MENVKSSTFLLFTVAFFFMLAATNCSDNSLGDLPTDMKKQIIDGTYQMEGIQIIKKMCGVGCTIGEPGEELSRDTIEVSFEVDIRLIEHRKDTLLITGLEGADKPVSNISYTGTTTRKDCDVKPYYPECPFVRMNGNVLDIDMFSPFGLYEGSGFLEDGKIMLNTRFYYRTNDVEYELTGRKRVDENPG